jgi:1-deoxy-D-xylulose-5-phosphate synthase
LLDIAYLRGYPNIILMAPKDEAEMRDMMLTAIEHKGPAALRYPRGNGKGVDVSAAPKQIEVGKAELLQGNVDDGDVAILAYGPIAYTALDAAKSLEKNGIDVTVINARFVKPLDGKMIAALANSHRLIVTAEDAYLAGGFGSAVLELLVEKGLADEIKVVRIGVPDEIVTHGDPKILLANYGLDADGIYSRTLAAFEQMDAKTANPKRIKAVK